MGCLNAKAAEDEYAVKDVGGSPSGPDIPPAPKDDKKKAKQKNKDLVDNVMFLDKVPLFKRLPKDQHPMLATACETVEFKAGQDVIVQGDSGDAFFVIKSGVANVFKEQDNTKSQIATLKK